MKCTSCGAALPDGSTVCFECGAPQSVTEQPVKPQAVAEESPVVEQQTAQEGTKNACKHCGAPLPQGATVCYECGSAQTVVQPQSQSSQSVAAPTATVAGAKSKAIAALLAFFLGCYGIDQFYLGNVKRGIGRIVVTIFTYTIGGVIWGIVDCVRILTGKIKTDAHGNPLI